MVKKSKKKPKIFEKSEKFTFFLFFREEWWGFAKEKCYPLSFPILGGGDWTRALQSSPFHKYKKLNKSEKITFVQNNFFFAGKKGYALSFPILVKHISTGALQSSPF